MIKRLILSLVFFAQGSSVWPENSRRPFDMEGAVLCTYAITSGLIAVQKKCGPQNLKLSNALNDTIRKHREFVSRNTDWSNSELNAFEAEHSDLKGQTCAEIKQNGVQAMVDHIEKNVNQFIREMNEILARDREPVFNPCL